MIEVMSDNITENSIVITEGIQKLIDGTEIEIIK